MRMLNYEYINTRPKLITEKGGGNKIRQFFCLHRDIIKVCEKHRVRVRCLSCNKLSPGWEV